MHAYTHTYMRMYIHTCKECGCCMRDCVYHTHIHIHIHACIHTYMLHIKSACVAFIVYIDTYIHTYRGCAWHVSLRTAAGASFLGVHKASDPNQPAPIGSMIVLSTRPTPTISILLDIVRVSLYIYICLCAHVCMFSVSVCVCVCMYVYV